MLIFLFIDFHQCDENKKTVDRDRNKSRIWRGVEGGVEGESGYHFLRVNYNKMLPVYLKCTALESEPHALTMASIAGLWLK